MLYHNNTQGAQLAANGLDTASSWFWVALQSVLSVPEHAITLSLSDKRAGNFFEKKFLG
jgi:hypothetical protein